MSVTRSKNWLGGQRVDVPHLREVDSSVANDFDVLAGSIMAGEAALVVQGFRLRTTGAIGQPATALQIAVADSLLIHPLATASGSIHQVPSDRANEILGLTNPRLVGSFTSNAVNYIGVDLIRNPDSETSDIVQFVDVDTKKESAKRVPLAKTMDYKIYVSTQDFTGVPGLAPIAIIQTDAGNNVTSIKDARNMFFRLGQGGSVPDGQSSFVWPERSETESDFESGDKSLGSLKEWVDAVLSRVWELGGGEYWYSPTADRNVKLIRTGSPIVASGDWFNWDGTNVTWQGLKVLFDNSTGYVNEIQNQTTSQSGLTNLADGECIYVDLDRTQNRTGVNALRGVKASLTTLGTPTIPGSRYIFLWRYGSEVFARDSQWKVNATLPPATTAALGTVRLNTTPGNTASPVVPAITSTGSITITSTTAGVGQSAVVATGASSAATTGAGGSSSYGGDYSGAGNFRGGNGGVFQGGASSGTGASADGGAGVVSVGGEATGTGDGGIGGSFTGGDTTSGTPGRGVSATGGQNNGGVGGPGVVGIGGASDVDSDGGDGGQFYGAVSLTDPANPKGGRGAYGQGGDSGGVGRGGAGMEGLGGEGSSGDGGPGFLGTGGVSASAVDGPAYMATPDISSLVTSTKSNSGASFVHGTSAYSLNRMSALGFWSYKVADFTENWHYKTALSGITADSLPWVITNGTAATWTIQSTVGGYFSRWVDFAVNGDLTSVSRINTTGILPPLANSGMALEMDFEIALDAINDSTVIWAGMTSNVSAPMTALATTAAFRYFGASASGGLDTGSTWRAYSNHSPVTTTNTAVAIATATNPTQRMKIRVLGATINGTANTVVQYYINEAQVASHSWTSASSLPVAVFFHVAREQVATTRTVRLGPVRVQWARYANI